MKTEVYVICDKINPFGSFEEFHKLVVDEIDSFHRDQGGEVTSINSNNYRSKNSIIKHHLSYTHIVAKWLLWGY